jgi:putative transposase
VPDERGRGRQTRRSSLARGYAAQSRALPPGPFRRFNSSPEVIRLVVLMYVRFPLSLRNVEDLLFGRGIDVCHETVRFWWNRFGPMFAADIRRQRVSRMRGFASGTGILMRCR